MNKTKEIKTFVIALQLFADAVNHTYTNRTTDTTAVTGNDLSVENKTYYEKRLIDMAEPELIFDQFADKYPIPKNGGKTIEFRKFEPLTTDLSATTLTEGVTPEGQKLNASSIQATVSQHGGYVETNDVLNLTAIDPVVVQATSMIGTQAGAVLDKRTRNVVSGGLNVLYAPTVASGVETAVTSRSGLNSTSLMSLKLIRKAVNILKRSNAPKIDGYYIGMVHPDIASDVMGLDGWIDAHKYQDAKAIFKGEIGTYGGVRFIENTNAKIWKSSADGCPSYTEDSETKYYSVYGCLFFGKGAYAVTEVEGGGLQHIVKPLGAGDDPLNQRATVGWKALKAAEILVPDYLLRVECLSTISATAEAAAN